MKYRNRTPIWLAPLVLAAAMGGSFSQDGNNPRDNSPTGAPRDKGPGQNKSSGKNKVSRPIKGTLVVPEKLTIESLSGSRSVNLADLSWSLVKEGDRPVLRIAAAKYPLEELLFLKFPGAPRPAGAIEVQLTGGERLRGDVVRGDEENLVLRANGRFSGDLTVSLDYVRSLLIPSSFKNYGLLASFRRRELAVPVETDRLFLTRGEPVEGVLDAITPDGVIYSSDSLGTLTYPYSKLRAVQLAELEDDEEREAIDGILTNIHLVDGSIIRGQLREVGAKGLRLQHEHLGLVDIEMRSLLQLSFLGGRCQFLSDLEPSKVEENLGPLLVAKLPHRRDESVMGTPMRMKGQSFAKGIGVHAYSKLSFALGGKFQRFQSTIGLDASARPSGGQRGVAGSVVFRVLVDGKLLAEEAIGPSDSPKFLDLAVAGGSTLSLVVDLGEGKFVPALDRANWAEARLIK